MTPTTLIVGIGNYIMQDDAAGIHAVNAIREGYSFPDDIGLLDGGTMGLDLLPYIEGCKRLMMIDAVDFKEAPGTVKVIEGKDMKAFLDLKFSVHQIGIPDMLFALEFKGQTPPEMCLIGIQPKSLEMGTEMTEPINASFGSLIETAIKRLGVWDIIPEQTQTDKSNSEYRYVPGNSI